MTGIRPFLLSVSDDVIADLHERLRRARLLGDSPRRPLSGMTSAYLRELATAWLQFDWRAREDWLLAHPQFIADVNGDELHFAHLPSENADAPALIVMHGWPHTFALQLDLADLLPDFHVVVPSLPGYGFSPPYEDKPASCAHLAESMHALMVEVLGYERYLTYGEDVSANVSDLLAARHPDTVAGIIATHPHFPTQAERAGLTDADAVAFFERIAAAHGSDGAYGHVQATRPDTLATGLNDSPVGLLAWIVEKLVEWSDVPTDAPPLLEQRIGRERLLTEAMIYWVSESIGTSFRTYYEGADTHPNPSRRCRCRPPCSSRRTSTTTPNRWPASSIATCACSSASPREATSRQPRYRSPSRGA